LTDETITLEYHVPRLGKITARLYPYAAHTYRLLDKYKHIDRMRRIDHLGVIRTVYEGAHHSRWEYVMTQLGLIHQLCTRKDDEGVKSARGLGLSSNTVEFKGHKPSGAEILQIWVLLWNSGHLPGTFSTERAFLRAIQKHNDLRSTIYRGLPKNKNIRKYFREIIANDDIYAFHKILTYFYLERYRRYKGPFPEFIDFLIDILNFYNFKSKKHTEKQDNLKNIFRRVRQISYLFLDSQYGPIPMNFDLPTIFLNLPDHLSDLFQERHSPIIRTLDSFEEFLSVNMYHSAESIRAHGFHARKIIRMIEEEKEIRNKILKFHEFIIKKEKEFIPIHKDWDNATVIRLLFNIYPYFLTSTFKKYLTYDEEEKLNKKYGVNSCQLTIQASPNTKIIALTLAFLPNCHEQKSIEILARFCGDIFRLNKNIEKDHKKSKITTIFIDRIFQNPYQELLLFTLSHITGDDFSFRFKDENQFPFTTLAIRGSNKGANKINNIYYKLKRNLSETRIHEFKVLEQALRELKLRSNMLISLPQILAYSPNRKHLTDLDGLAIGFRKGKLGVLLVEAKDRRSRSKSTAEKQLKKTILELKFKTSATPEIKILDRYGAYCYLPIDGVI